LDVVFGGECFEGRERELGAAGELQFLCEIVARRNELGACLEYESQRSCSRILRRINNTHIILLPYLNTLAIVETDYIDLAL
jgi:hypothetical protein